MWLVLAASYPYFAKRLLTDPNPYLRDALIELLFKDGRFRWSRLENLLVQGRKDRDFSAKDALQPVLKVLLSPDGEELKTLVIKESVRVTEAFTLSTISDTYKFIPDFMRSLVFNGNANGPLMMSDAEMQSLTELRDQVLRIWGLLQSSEDFDPALLLPILQVRAIILQRIVKGQTYKFLTATRKSKNWCIDYSSLLMLFSSQLALRDHNYNNSC